MSANSQHATGALVPISVVHAGQQVDLVLPAAVPLAELLPGMVAALGRLSVDTATQGFQVVTSAGDELDQGMSLTEQDVFAGTVLTLETAGEATTDARFDDLVEAIGTSVEASRSPWRRGDSVQLSAYSAAGMFVVAAALLLLGGNPIATGILALAGAGLVLAAAAVVLRAGTIGGAVALTLTVPALLGSGAFAALAGPDTPFRLGAAGLGVLLGSAACLILPDRFRMVSSGPLLVGSALLLQNALVELIGLTDQRAAALVAAIVTVIVLLAPWLGLAQVPARIDALAPRPRQQINANQVAAQVGNGEVAVLALRIAAGLLTIALAPMVAVDLTGTLLMACIGLGTMLGTRSLYGRAEVLAGTIGGMLTLVSTGLASALNSPDSLPYLTGIAILAGGFVLAWNVVSPKLRPSLSRAANVLQITALSAVLPLTVMLLGFV